MLRLGLSTAERRRDDARSFHDNACLTTAIMTLFSRRIIHRELSCVSPAFLDFVPGVDLCLVKHCFYVCVSFLASSDVENGAHAEMHQ